MTGQRHLLTKPVRSRFLYSLMSLMLVGTCAGCLQQSSKTELAMQADPAGQPGVYLITGKTNLPNQTRITVQAIRVLRSTDRASRLTNFDQTYAILARQPVEVIDGKWQTTLNLLKSDPNGRSLETWQPYNSQLGLNLAPDSLVAFQAVTDPVNRSLDVEQQPGTTAQGESLMVRFTTDGKSYLQAEQALSIAPPSLQAAKPSTSMDAKLGSPAIVTVQAVSKQSKESSILKTQLNAPLSPIEFLR